VVKTLEEALEQLRHDPSRPVRTTITGLRAENRLA